MLPWRPTAGHSSACLPTCPPSPYSHHIHTLFAVPWFTMFKMLAGGEVQTSTKAAAQAKCGVLMMQSFELSFPWQ